MLEEFVHVSASVTNFFVTLTLLVIASSLVYFMVAMRGLPFRRYLFGLVLFLFVGAAAVASEGWLPGKLQGALAAATGLLSLIVACSVPKFTLKARTFIESLRVEREHGSQLESAYEDLGVKYERLKEQDRAKMDFFANVSHDLRTPLTLILAPLENVLRSSTGGPEEKSQLELIDRNARRLLSHVNDLMDLSKLDAGGLRPVFEKGDLSEVVRATCANFELAAKDRSIRFEVSGENKIPAEFDCGMIERIVLNLLANAFKFTPAAGTIQVRLKRDRDAAVIEISDSGPGVAEDQRQKIFGRFYQAESTLARAGTGLGLAITKDLVDLHRGRVEVGDAPEGGALFSVRIPYKQPGAQEKHSCVAPDRDEIVPSLIDAPASVESEFRSTADTVLLVEDNPDLNRFIASSLMPYYSVVACGNGRQALQKLETVDPDLILTDLVMPEMGGEQLIRAIRQHGDWDHIPVIVLTAKADDRSRVQILRDGAQDFILKPFSRDELVARCANLIAMKKARELLQKELHSQVTDLEALANEISTQRRELQQSMEKMRAARDEATRAARAKDNFLGMVSHEVRTPLTAMQMQLEMFQRSFDRELNERQRSLLSRVFQSSERSLDIMDRLLEYTRLQSGKITPSTEEFELPSIAEESVRSFAPEAKRKGILLEFVKPMEEIPHVHSDLQLVRMVLQNLIENAVKYTDKGLVRVALRRGGKSVRVMIDDTGPGIEADMLDKIFEPFEQAAPLERKHKPGFGLGLSIAKQAADALGGMIKLRSRPGRGSRFIFEIPNG